VLERAVKALGLYSRPLDYEKNFSSPLKKFFITTRAKMFQRELDQIKNEDQKKYMFFKLAVDSLKDSVKVEPVRDTDIFTISVRDYSSLGSMILANVVSRSYVIYDLEQQLAETQLKYGDKHQAVAQLKDSIDKMNKSLNGEILPDMEAIGPASVKIVEQATIPLRPAGFPKSLTFVLAIFMSIFLGVMLAYVFEYLDQTFKSPEDVENFLNLPFLGSIPKDAKEFSYRNVSDQVYLIMKDKNLKSLMLASALPGEGVTPIITHLARYLSKEAGHKVLLIDANLRTPSVHLFLSDANPRKSEGHQFLKASRSPGLSTILEGKSTFEKAVQDLGNNLHVLTAGETGLNPITLLGVHAMADLLKSVKDKYDAILIDCASLKDYKDAVVIASFIDGTILVVNEGKTRRQVVKYAISSLEQKKANLVGTILNNRSFFIPRAIYDRL
jgi:capsular exopolysaccharide synthesis family protein